MNINEIRQKYPQYSDLSDQQLAEALHRKHYADIEFNEFAAKIGLQQPQIAQETQTVQDPSLYQQAGQLVEEYAPALPELGAAITHGSTRLLDIFTTQPYNAAMELAGQHGRVPSITESLSHVTTGEFMEPGIAREAIRTGGELAAPGGTAGAGFRAAARSLPAFQAGESVTRGVVRSLGQTTPQTEAALSGIAGAGAVIGEEIGEEFEQPEIGRQVGMILSPLSASIATNTVKQVTTASAKNLLKQASPTINGLKTAARDIYKQIDDTGAIVSQQKINRLSNQVNEKLKTAAYDQDLHPNLRVFLTRLDEAKGGNLSVTDLDILRRKLGPARSSTNVDEQRIARIAADVVDDFMDSLKQSDFVEGSGNVGAMYRDARKLWQQSRKSQMLEEAFFNAENQATGFENGIRVQFRSILRNSKKRKMFNQDEISAMQQVVKGTKTSNLLKLLGRFGFNEQQATNIIGGSLAAGGGATLGAALGGASGAGIGAISAVAAGQISRNLAQRLTASNAKFAQALVSSGRDGNQIFKEYLKAVPKAQRDPRDLAQLLIGTNADIANIKAALKNPTKHQRDLIGNTIFYIELLNRQQNDDNNDQNN